MPETISQEMLPYHRKVLLALRETGEEFEQAQKALESAALKLERAKGAYYAWGAHLMEAYAMSEGDEVTEDGEIVRAPASQ